MEKKIYEAPRVCIYEVEAQPILAGSNTDQDATGNFKANGTVSYGDNDDVWEDSDE